MPVWSIVLLVVYVLGFIGFLVAIFAEAPKHQAEIRLFHFVVAAIWPLWVLWYAWTAAGDWIEARRKKRGV